MMKKILFVLFFVLLGCIFTEAQAQSNYPTSKGDDYRAYENSGQTGSKKKKRRKSKKSATVDVYDLKIQEYEERMQANSKKYKKMSKGMQKPQFSDPAYFGHKKKPRKRKPGKKKYCKECQLVH